MPVKTKKPARPKKGGRKDLREKINVHALIEALEKHVLGDIEMTPTQVSAALALLKKILPDVAAPTRKGDDADAGISHEDALKELQ